MHLEPPTRCPGSVLVVCSRCHLSPFEHGLFPVGEVLGVIVGGVLGIVVGERCWASSLLVGLGVVAGGHLVVIVVGVVVVV